MGEAKGELEGFCLLILKDSVKYSSLSAVT